MLYLLSLKRFNPVALILRTSHEHLNRWHRTLGRICYLLIALHGVLYLNFYIQVRGLHAAFFRAVPALGMLGLFCMTFLNATTLRIIRKLSYRIFLITHILAALATPFIIWLHVPHGRVFMAEALLAAIIDLAVRRFSRVTSLCTLEAILGTDLVKVTVTNAAETMIRNLASRPTSHIYLSIPPRSRSNKSPLLLAHLGFEFICNPFTVASVDKEAEEFTLIARQMRGPTTKTLASLSSLQPIDTKVALSFDGPYGGGTHFPSFAGSAFGRVLLVAGGVGATFILPLYKHIRAENPSLRVEMIWAVRDINEAAWPVTQPGGEILRDGGVRLFCTGSETESSNSLTYDSSSVSDVEMSSLEKGGKEDDKSIPVESFERPDLRRIVNELFQQGRCERVGVIVCGPGQMATDVRRSTASWVKKGRDVWFHNESYS